MAWENREYYKEGRGGGGGIGNRMNQKSVVFWLIIINVVVFVWDGIFGSATRGGFLSLFPIGYFSVDKAVFGGQVWRFFTYQFLHGDFFHLLFNGIGLYFFGPMMERWWGSRRFLAFYLFCGVSGAVVASVLGAIPGIGIFPVGAMLIGASGAVFGILAGCAVAFPHQRVMLLFPPIPMSMRTMALVFLGIAALSVIAGSANAGGEAAHLGGALLGFLFMKKPKVLDWADRISPGDVKESMEKGRFERKLKQEHATEEEVDRILAKVREKGLQSLSRSEKKTLNQETARKNQE